MASQAMAGLQQQVSSCHALPGSYPERMVIRASHAWCPQRTSTLPSATAQCQQPWASSSTSRTRSASHHSTRLQAIMPGVFVAAVEAQPKLADLEMQTIMNVQGYISPEVPSDSQACVFAVYDSKDKLQYVGFSKDLRATLRTLFSRRPDKVYGYKAVHLPSMDQAAMVATRDAWFAECGGPPAGNKLALERNLWQQPVDAGAISQRGKQGAAEEMAKALLTQIKARGCKEEFIANPMLLSNGQVDFLPSIALTPEQLEEQRQALVESASKSRTATALVDGQPQQYTIMYSRTFPTKGGVMVDLTVTHDNRETNHRIIVGRGYYEPYGVGPDVVVEAALSLLLGKKVPRQTEGMLQSSQFPINYFSISELEQWFGADFYSAFEGAAGRALDQNGDANGNGLNASFWRFNRVFDYGPINQESAESLSIIGAREDESK